MTGFYVKRNIALNWITKVHPKILLGFVAKFPFQYWANLSEWTSIPQKLINLRNLLDIRSKTWPASLKLLRAIQHQQKVKKSNKIFSINTLTLLEPKKLK